MKDRVAAPLCVLGSLGVVRDGEQVRLGSPLQRRLLAVLVVHANEVVSNDRLVDVLWGDEPPRTAMHGLQTLLSRLRATLGDGRLETRPPGYRLCVASGEVDALQFEELVRVGLGSPRRPEVALGVFDEALGLWRGSPYAEFASEEFATAEVARLVELHARAIEERAAALLELSRPEDVIGELEAQIAVEPFRERLRALMILALVRAGRPVESLRAYDAFRRFVADEVGVVPSPGLQALNDDIVRQHPDVVWAGSPTKIPDTAHLPSGTVSFLFTDVEASTRLWDESPDVMSHAMVRHDELLRDAVESHDGFIVKNAGDGFHAVFATAHDAVTAAVAAQRRLLADEWNVAQTVRVRMGIHSGEAEVRDGDYSGGAVNRAERLMSVAHGGQIVVSATTEELLHDALPEKYGFIDLGEHQLRDLAQPDRLFQVTHPDLGREFPPLRTLDVFPRNNLPRQVTTFVGREAEIASVTELVCRLSLVTLTGVGGVGKTRLSLQVAAELLPRFPDGVWFCELGTASDEVLMFHAVADAVGAHQREGMSMADSIGEYLREREVLVVLDNCEHLLVDAALLASKLLQRCPKVRVLATSREGLGVAGEQLVALSSLSVPDVSADADAITASEAIQLFVHRAMAARAGFTLGPANLAAVAEICRRLDGMPLAIELAAARITAMSPAEIAARLDDRFRLLTGGKRSRVERHQTLRAAVEWSYSLLAARERTVFERLGVFVGSFDAAAAEAVVTDDAVEGWDVLQCLGSLVEKSMVLAEFADEATTRYRLLETFRAFAREQLDTAGETDHWRRRYAEHYAAFCELAGPELGSADEVAWERRVEAELDNIRAVLRWGSDATAQADADLALRIIIALTIHESFTTTWSTQPWADALKARARSSSIAGRSGVIAAAAFSHMLHDDLEDAERLAREALDTPAGPGASRFIAISYQVLSSVRYRQRGPAEALELVAEGHRALDAADAPSTDHCPLHDLGSQFCLSVGDLDGARKEADAYVKIARTTGKPSKISIALSTEGRAWFSEDPDRALAAFDESIALARAGGTNTGLALLGAAQLRARAGDRFGALSQLRDAIAICHDRGSRINLGSAVERAVAILASLRDDTLAATCAGVVQAHVVTPSRTLPQVDRTAARVAERLGPDAYQAAHTRGATLAFEKVAPTLLAALDDLLATTDAPTPTGHT